jgi:hypothetical protein
MECNMARCVWALSDGSMVQYMVSNGDTNERLWLFEMIETLPHNQITIVSVYFVGIGLYGGKLSMNTYSGVRCPPMPS